MLCSVWFELFVVVVDVCLLLVVWRCYALFVVRGCLSDVCRCVLLVVYCACCVVCGLSCLLCVDPVLCNALCCCVCRSVCML